MSAGREISRPALIFSAVFNFPDLRAFNLGFPFNSACPDRC